MPKMGEILNFLSVFDFEEEKLVSLYSLAKVYVANYVLCQFYHPFYHGEIMPSNVGVTISTWQFSRSCSCLLSNLHVGNILNL